MQLWLYFLAFSVGFIAFAVYITIVLLITYYLFLLLFLPRTSYFSYESRGSSYVDQSFTVFLTSLYQAGGLVFTAIQGVANSFVQSFYLCYTILLYVSYL